nr:unnamed protein product [Digitaria exilis]
MAKLHPVCASWFPPATTVAAANSWHIARPTSKVSHVQPLGRRGSSPAPIRIQVRGRDAFRFRSQKKGADHHPAGPEPERDDNLPDTAAKKEIPFVDLIPEYPDACPVMQELRRYHVALAAAAGMREAPDMFRKEKDFISRHRIEIASSSAKVRPLPPPPPAVAASAGRRRRPPPSTSAQAARPREVRQPASRACQALPASRASPAPGRPASRSGHPVTIASLSQEQERHSFSNGGAGGLLGGNVKQENQPLRPFFDEWPGTRDSWSEMDEARSNRTSFSTTQLSISIPMPRYIASLDLGTTEFSQDTSNQMIMSYASIIRDVADDAYQKGIKIDSIPSFIDALRGLGVVCRILVQDTVAMLKDGPLKNSISSAMETQSHEFDKKLDILLEELKVATEKKHTVVMDVLLYGMKHAESYTSQLILHRVDAIIDLLYDKTCSMVSTL